MASARGFQLAPQTRQGIAHHRARDATSTAPRLEVPATQHELALGIPSQNRAALQIRRTACGFEQVRRRGLESFDELRRLPSWIWQLEPHRERGTATMLRRESKRIGCPHCGAWNTGTGRLEASAPSRDASF